MGARGKGGGIDQKENAVVACCVDANWTAVLERGKRKKKDLEENSRNPGLLYFHLGQ